MEGYAYLSKRWVMDRPAKEPPTTKTVFVMELLDTIICRLRLIAREVVVQVKRGGQTRNKSRAGVWPRRNPTSRRGLRQRYIVKVQSRPSIQHPKLAININLHINYPAPV